MIGMKERFEYCLDLSQTGARQQEVLPVEFELRRLSAFDHEDLSELMIDAYRGTLDDDGGSLWMAREEVSRFYQGVYGAPLVNCSWLCFRKEDLVFRKNETGERDFSSEIPLAACLSTWWGPKNAPLIAFAMTRKEWKRRRLGSLVLDEALNSLRRRQIKSVWAVITSGNLPSERLFRRFGFEQFVPRMPAAHKRDDSSRLLFPPP